MHVFHISSIVTNIVTNIHVVTDLVTDIVTRVLRASEFCTDKLCINNSHMAICVA